MQLDREKYTATILLPISAAIVIFVLASFAMTIGVKKLCRNLFYYTSCHCCLKQIIKFRSGVRMEDQIGGPIRNFMANDEAMAEVMANMSEEEGKPKDHN